MVWMHRANRAVRRWAGTAVTAVRRAWEGPGRERDLAVQAGKGALAAWVAWAVVGWWLAAPMAFVAPWVAVVLVESTVYRSVAHGLQQLVAIAVGTTLATAVALWWDSTMVAMALVLPTVLLLGQWQRLGNQGVYAATGALFVLTGGEVTVGGAAARVLEAVFGAAVGVTVNVLIRPPVYLRDARAALEDTAREAHELLGAVADGLATGEWDAHAAGDWHVRALRLGRLVDQARSAIGWGRESMRVNPLGRRRRALSPPGEKYADAVEVLDYVAVHIAGVTRTVWETADSEEAGRPPRSSPVPTRISCVIQPAPSGCTVRPGSARAALTNPPRSNCARRSRSSTAPWTRSADGCREPCPTTRPHWRPTERCWPRRIVWPTNSCRTDTAEWRGWGGKARRPGVRAGSQGTRRFQRPRPRRGPPPDRGPEPQSGTAVRTRVHVKP